VPCVLVLAVVLVKLASLGRPDPAVAETD
jgi:hypothetical protein